jgi:hypothetical protein
MRTDGYEERNMRFSRLTRPRLMINFMTSSCGVQGQEKPSAPPPPNQFIAAVHILVHYKVVLRFVFWRVCFDLSYIKPALLFP